MQLFPKSPEIGEEEGFTPENDIFGRKGIGDGMTNILTSVKDPLVVAVDAQWGDGKTTFLKMWAGSLRKQGIPVVFFDAFENDYIDDAFLALAGEVIGLAEELGKKKSPATKKLVKGAVGVGKVLLRSSLRVGVSAASAGLVSGTALESVASELKGEATQLLDDHIGRLITNHSRNRHDLETFKQALGQLAALLATASDNDQTLLEDRPLIFIIDELDRCRPIFALEVLERVKHVFDAPNVHFVLGADLRQLRNSVKVAYGPDIDAQSYLHKFIHLTVYLADPSQHARDTTTRKFLAYIRKQLEFHPDDRSSLDFVSEQVALVAERKNLSLRSIERIMSMVSIAFRFTNRNAIRPGPIVGGLCILKLTDPELFLKAKRGTLRYDEVVAALMLDQPPSEMLAHDHEMAVEWWRLCLDETAPAELIRRFNDGTYRFRGIDERRDFVPFTANEVIDRLNPR